MSESKGRAWLSKLRVTMVVVGVGEVKGVTHVFHPPDPEGTSPG